MAKKTTRRSSKAKTAKAATKTTNQVLVVNMIPKSLSGETRKLYFHFHGDSILNVDLVDPGGAKFRSR